MIRHLASLFVIAAASCASPKAPEPLHGIESTTPSLATAERSSEIATTVPSRLPGQLDLETGHVAVLTNWYQDAFGLVSQDRKEYGELRLAAERSESGLVQVHIQSTMQSGVALDLRFQLVGDRVTQCIADGTWRHDRGSPEDSGGKLGDLTGLARTYLHEGKLSCLFVVRGIVGRRHDASDPPDLVMGGFELVLPPQATREIAKSAAVLQPGQLELQSVSIAVDSNWYQDMFGLVREGDDASKRLRLDAKWRANDRLQVHIKSTYESGLALDLYFRFVGDQVTSCVVEGQWRHDVGGKAEDFAGKLSDPTGFARVYVNEGRLWCQFEVRGMVSWVHKPGDPPTQVSGGFNVLLPPRNQ